MVVVVVVVEITTVSMHLTLPIVSWGVRVPQIDKFSQI